MSPARGPSAPQSLVFVALLWLLAVLAACLRAVGADLAGPAVALAGMPGGGAGLVPALARAAGGFGVIAFLGLAAAGMGGLVMGHGAGNRMGHGGRQPGELPLGLGVGLALIGLVLLGLGLAGLLKVPVVVGGLLAAAAASKRLFPPGLRFPRGRAIPFLAIPALAVLALLGHVMCAMAPETEVDSLYYHLERTFAFTETGRVSLGAVRASPFFPSMWELLMVPPFMLGGETAARLLNPFVLAVSALLLRRALARDGSRGGWLAASLFVSASIVGGAASSCKNDMLAVLFSFAAFRFALSGRGLLCGFMLGCAAGVKYTVAPAILATFALVAWPVTTRRGWLVRWGSIAGCLAGGAAAFSPWLLVTFAWTGNPVFPFAPGIFGGGLSAASLTLYAQEWHGYLLGAYDTLPAKLRALWTVATVDGSFFLPALALPAVVFLISRRGPGRVWAACAAAEYLGWLITMPRARYLLPAAPLLCAAVEMSLPVFPRSVMWRRGVLAACAAVIALEAGRAWFGVSTDRFARVAVAVGARSPAAYRLARLGGYAHAASWIDDHLPRSAGLIVYGDLRSFLTGRRSLVRHKPEAPVFLAAASASPDVRHLEHKLRQLGATHMLYNRTTAVFWREMLAGIRPDRRTLRLWSAYFRLHARLVYEPPFVDVRNGAFYVVEFGTKPRRSGIVLPGCEGWLWEPERLMLEGRPAEAKRVFDDIARDTGRCAMVRQAYATVLEPVIGGPRAEAILIEVERVGMRSASLYDRLAGYAAARGRMDLAVEWRAKATALGFPAWLAAHGDGKR